MYIVKITKTTAKHAEVNERSLHFRGQKKIPFYITELKADKFCQIMHVFFLRTMLSFLLRKLSRLLKCWLNFMKNKDVISF